MSSVLVTLLSLVSGWFFPSVSQPAYSQSVCTSCHAALAPLGEKKFYIYDDPIIRMASFLQEAQVVVDAGKAAYSPDIELYQLFDAHPRRTLDPDLAYFFIIPIPVEYAMVIDHAVGQNGKHVPKVKRAFRALLNSSIFQREEGRKHFLPLHDWRFGYDDENRGGQTKEFREQLRHITIGGMEHKKIHSSRWPRTVQRNKITIPYGLVKQSTRLDEALLAEGNKIPSHSLTEATFEEWAKRPYKLFYHTRERDSAFGATKLRQFFDKEKGGFGKPDAFTWNVSIGYSLESTIFEERLKQSQFCLVVRGDSPTSHAFNRALAVNCIPIIISDAFAVAGMPFYPYLTSDSFTLSISESRFRKNPWFELSKILVAHAGDVPTVSMYEKYQFMRNCARPALLYGHPQTLVPEYIMLNMLDPKTDSWLYILDEKGWQ